MVTHGQEKIPLINVINRTTQNMCKVRKSIFLDERFKHTSTVKGTRGFHFFKPLGKFEIGINFSNDASCAFTYKLNLMSIKQYEKCVKQGDFASVTYDQKWYFSIIQELDAENGDVLVHFLHPSGPCRSFYWPKNTDKSWIPIEHILCIVFSNCKRTISFFRTFNEKH